MGGVTTRLANRYPFLSDTADVPRDVLNLANDLDKAAIFGVGTLAARPASAGGTPGISGRFYYANDAGVSAGDLWFDFGTGYRKVPLHETDGSLRVGPVTINGVSTGTVYAPNADFRSSADVYVSAQGTGRVVLRNLTAGAVVSMDSTGKLLFSYADDVNLYRYNSTTLATDSNFSAQRSVATNSVTLGAIGPGYGMLIGGDTNLYRSSADVLATDDQLLQTSGAQVAGKPWGLQVGVGLPMHYQGYIGGGAHGFIGHNAWLGSDSVQRWDGTHVSFGSRSIMFNFGGPATGITFYADAVASTAGGTFTPNARMTIRNDGDVQIFNKLLIGADTNIYRSSAGNLKTDASFAVYRQFDLLNAINDTQPLIRLYGASGANGDQRILLGPGGSTAPDVMLYRAAADVLATDDSFFANVDVRARFNGDQAILGSAGPTGQSGIKLGAAGDTNLYRYGVGLLATDHQLFTMRGTGAQIRMGSNSGVATIWFGNASGDTGDTSIERAGVGALRIRSQVYASGNVVAREGDAQQVTMGYAGPISQAGLILGQGGDTNLFRQNIGSLATSGHFSIGAGSNAGFNLNFGAGATIHNPVQYTLVHSAYTTFSHGGSTPVAGGTMGCIGITDRAGSNMPGFVSGGIILFATGGFLYAKLGDAIKQLFP